jgi:hypothetical protein
MRDYGRSNFLAGRPLGPSPVGRRHDVWLFGERERRGPQNERAASAYQLELNMLLLL